MDKKPLSKKKLNQVKKIAKNGSIEITSKRPKDEYVEKLPKELKSSAFNSHIYYRKMTEDKLEQIIERIIFDAQQGCKHAINFVLERSFREEPEIKKHKFEGLKGVNSMEKITNAFELSLAASGEGILSFKDLNDISKTLSTFSSHLRDSENIMQLKESLKDISYTLINICKEAKIEEPEQIKKLIDILDEEKNENEKN